MKKIISLILALFLISTSGFAEKKIVKYPDLDGLRESSFGYQLLKLALSKVDNSYDVIVSGNSMVQSRAFAELDSETISVVDSGAGKDVEEKYDPIYIPIDMGLLGWRIFIINKDLKEEFAKIKTLEELKSKKAGQGLGWTDAAIIKNSGIEVITSTKVEQLIKMVDKKRFDFFPLGANETHGFLNKFGKDIPNLIVEDTLVLVYPFARFFYVKKGNKQLHDDIALGLERAYDDGSFKEFLFNHPFFKEGIEKSNLNNRTIIKIDNPFVTEEFKKIDSKWWYQL